MDKWKSGNWVTRNGRSARITYNSYNNSWIAEIIGLPEGRVSQEFSATFDGGAPQAIRFANRYLNRRTKQPA